MDYSPHLLQPEYYLYSDNVPPRQIRHAGDTAPVAKCRVLSLFSSVFWRPTSTKLCTGYGTGRLESSCYDHRFHYVKAVGNTHWSRSVKVFGKNVQEDARK